MKTLLESTRDYGHSMDVILFTNPPIDGGGATTCRLW